MTTNYQLPTWTDLHQWISEKPDGAVVGFSKDMFLGPLNLYFAETVKVSQGKYWMIGLASASVLVWDQPGKYQEMYQYVSKTPQWLHDFKHICDDLADVGYEFMHPLRPITARMVKEALDTVARNLMEEA